MENAGPDYIGRILRADGIPMGTCFQVRPRVLVTARHILAALGADTLGTRVSVDELSGGPAGPAIVAALDPVHDVAVLTRDLPLPSAIGRLVPSKAVDVRTEVVITGVPTLVDRRSYRVLTATGRWQGTAMRDDGVRLGRLESPAVVPGMSGAPVRLLEGDAVIGLVSARYNSVDQWMRNTVWVVRSEDVARLVRPVLASVNRWPGYGFGATPLVVMTVSGSGEPDETQRLVLLALADAGLSATPRIVDRHVLIEQSLSEHSAVLAGRFVRALDDRAREHPSAGCFKVALVIAGSDAEPPPQLGELAHLDDALTRATDARVVVVVSDDFYDQVIRRARGVVDASKFLQVASTAGPTWIHVPGCPSPPGVTRAGPPAKSWREP